MRKLISLFIVLAIIFGFGLAIAQDNDPHLVCDPMKKDRVSYYEIEINDNTVEVQPTEVNATHIRIYYNISYLEPGNYKARARSVNSTWNATSTWSNTASWTVPSDGDMPTCINFREEE